MNRSFRKAAILVGIALALVFGDAIAADISVKADDGSKHFVLALRREGNVVGLGPFAGTSVLERGRHDIEPAACGGNPRNYVVFTASKDDVAYVKWQVRAMFVPGAEGKSKLLNNGF